MISLYAPTEDFIKVERGVLGADVTAGSSVSVDVTNNDGLSDNDFIVIGHEGNELCEIQQIGGVVSAGADVTIDTVKFNHQKGEPWVKYRYDKRKFYGSTTEGGTYTELTADGSPVLIQVDDPQGSRIEYTGGEGYTYFKSTYYNSTDTTESSVSDADAVEADESKRYSSLYAIRKHAGLVGNSLYPEQRFELKRQQAESEINSYIAKKYVLPLSEVPGMIKYICELLGAGYIDYEEFGKEGEGVKWLGEARGMLKKIADGKMTLIGADGTEVTRVTKVGRLDGYPDGTIDDGAVDARKFKIGDQA